MDQSSFLRRGERQAALAKLTRFVCASIDGARAVEAPFYHLEFDRIFPSDFYQSMLAALPTSADYRPMHGRSRTQTRVKIDLFPEYIRHLPPEKFGVWDLVGAALRSTDVKDAFVRGLEPGLIQRFGARFTNVGLYPIPILTRDTAGYRIPPHTDTQWKGITVQLYLPRDQSNLRIGTSFHKVLADGSKPEATRMRFAPNTGYAFVVGNNTWHSVEPVGPEVTTRDSILLTYFVDAGLTRILRNRGKRLGNFLLNEARNLRRG